MSGKTHPLFVDSYISQHCSVIIEYMSVSKGLQRDTVTAELFSIPQLIFVSGP